MNKDAERKSFPTGSLAQALAHAEQLMGHSPGIAAKQAQAILEAVPGHPQAQLLLGRAWRRCGRAAEARGLLDRLVVSQPVSAPTRLELARAALAVGDETSALIALNAAVSLNPNYTEAWLLVAELHGIRDETTLAARARAHAMRASAVDPELVEAALALCDERLDVAEARLRARLKRLPTDTAAIRMLAEVAARIGRYEDSALLLEDGLAIDPDFDEARAMYAQILQRQGRAVAALIEVDRLLAKRAQHPGWRSLKAAILVRLGRYSEAINLYAALLQERPDQPKGWMSYGHALKTVGRQEDAIAAYRKAIEQAPFMGEAWWSLANLKTFRFSAADMALMHTALVDSPTDDDRLHLEFALGKACEDIHQDVLAFAHYVSGNAIRRRQLDYHPDIVTGQVNQSIAMMNAAFFSNRAGGGCQARDPIFIVGLPRSGSTLIEQILASHSLVEGTMELPDITAIARRLGRPDATGVDPGYLTALAGLSPDERSALGHEYLRRTRAQRQTDRPFFIDKMPNNWLYVPLIRSILPNATIIDARRHPLACCLSAFKQHFARGQAFSYDLVDLGGYYRNYVRLMSHVDEVQPGTVHRVIYERMVANTGEEILRLLAHVGLPFEQSCQEYWKSERAVRTASSEQVRTPIFNDAVEHWRRFEDGLGALRSTLGPLVELYPETPPPVKK